MWRPDLLSLRLFVAVCTEGSIARAAERESIDPSAISRRIGEIEAASGVALLLRSGRGVNVTEAGYRFLQQARQVLDRADRIPDMLREYSSGRSGHVCLRADIAAITELLPRDLGCFRRERPGIEIDLLECGGPEAVAAVKDGRADLAICREEHVHGAISTQHYGWTRLAAVVAATHVLASRIDVGCAELFGHEFIGTEFDQDTTERLRMQAVLMGLPWRQRLRARTCQAAGQLIAERLGIGVLPQGAARAMAAPLGLAVVPITDPWAQQRLVICHDAVISPSLAAEQLLCHLATSGEGRNPP